jgi:hypothetical protein
MRSRAGEKSLVCFCCRFLLGSIPRLFLPFRRRRGCQHSHCQWQQASEVTGCRLTPLHCHWQTGSAAAWQCQSSSIGNYLSPPRRATGEPVARGIGFPTRTTCRHSGPYCTLHYTAPPGQRDTCPFAAGCRPLSSGSSGCHRRVNRRLVFKTNLCQWSSRPIHILGTLRHVYANRTNSSFCTK